MAAPTLMQYLQQLEQNGVSHVEIDDSARRVLRELYTRGSARRPKTTSSPSAQGTDNARDTPAAPVQIRATGTTATDQIASLAAIAANWQPAKALGSLRDTMVFSTGDPTADLMLVGEAPGYHEEQKGEPFVGPAGQKLDQILKAMGLSRGEVYLSNICKFRPAMKMQTTNNRKPSPEELATSLPFLRAEIDVVKPRVIVALGASAAQGLLNQLQTPVGQLRESWHQFQGIPLRVTFHPSYLLRQEDGLSEKRKLWEDMLAVMEKLSLPITEKQRGFFQS